MNELSPKARFDALASLLRLEPSNIDAIRHSINPLLGDINELVRRLDETMRHERASDIVADLSSGTRERLQSLLASFIMRTINCNFDEDYCNYAVEVARGEGVPPGLFSIALALANDYVAQTLPASIEDRERLAEMLTSWNRLTCVLRELTRPS